MHHLYDYAAMSSAKAYIFNAMREDLAKTLDVPAFARGDLFYIQNLVNTLKAAAGSGSFSPASKPPCSVWWTELPFCHWRAPGITSVPLMVMQV